MTPAEKEKLDILAGTRSKAAADMAAVRRQDIKPVLELPAKLQSAPVSAAPTAADYNALHNDVLALHTALASMSASLRSSYGR